MPAPLAETHLAERLRTGGHDGTRLRTSGHDGTRLRTGGHDGTSLWTGGHDETILWTGGHDETILWTGGHDGRDSGMAAVTESSLRRHAHGPLAKRLMHTAHFSGNTSGVSKSSSDWLN